MTRGRMALEGRHAVAVLVVGGRTRDVVLANTRPRATEASLSATNPET